MSLVTSASVFVCFQNKNIPEILFKKKNKQKIECRNHFVIDHKILFLCHTQIKARNNQILEFYACKNCQSDRHFLNSKFIPRIGMRPNSMWWPALSEWERKRKPNPNGRRMPKRNATRKVMYQTLVSRAEKNFLQNHFHRSFTTFCKRCEFHGANKMHTIFFLWHLPTKRTENGNQNTFFILMYSYVSVCMWFASLFLSFGILLLIFSFFISFIFFLSFSRLPCSHSHQIKCAWKRVRSKTFRSNRELLDKQFKLSSCCSDMMIFLLLAHSPLLVVQTLISKKGTI